MLLPACDRSLDGVHEARVHLHELLARLPLGSLRRPLSSKAAPLELFFARNIQLPRLFILVCDRTHAHDGPPASGESAKTSQDAPGVRGRRTANVPGRSTGNRLTDCSGVSTPPSGNSAIRTSIGTRPGFSTGWIGMRAMSGWSAGSAQVARGAEGVSVTTQSVGAAASSRREAAITGQGRSARLLFAELGNGELQRSHPEGTRCDGATGVGYSDQLDVQLIAGADAASLFVVQRQLIRLRCRCLPNSSRAGSKRP